MGALDEIGCMVALLLAVWIHSDQHMEAAEYIRLHTYYIPCAVTYRPVELTQLSELFFTYFVQEETHMRSVLFSMPAEYLGTILVEEPSC